MKIICAVDFTARTEAAAQVAADLARATRGSLELVHVVAPPTSELQALATDAARFEGELRSQAQQNLAVLAQKLRSTADVPVAVHLAEGVVAPELLSRAQAIAADLIVVGAHSRPVLERFVLGSAAERTVRHADRPVLVVPPGVEGLGKGEGGTARPNVMLALDGRSASDGALAFVRALRATVPCDVTVLRLYWPIEEYRRLGLRGPRDLFGPDPDVVADLELTLRMRVGVLPGSGHVRYVVAPAWGDPAAGILDAARERACDLLVMGAESRHGLARLVHPPVTERVARHARGVPVVFVPAPVSSETSVGVPGLFTVLAATDLSPGGNHAVPLAYALVAAHGGVVELCHVHERPLPEPAYVYENKRNELAPAERARLESELQSLIPPDAERLGITTRVTVIDGGQPAEAIVQAAERLNADAIVVGSRGKGGAVRSMLGSVSHAVLRGTHRAVLVVPPPAAA